MHSYAPHLHVQGVLNLRSTYMVPAVLQRASVCFSVPQCAYTYSTYMGHPHAKYAWATW